MKSKRGSALIVAVLLSVIMLAVLASLLTVTLGEYRGSFRSYLNTAAFSLAESGIDRAAAAIANKATLDAATVVASWPSEGGAAIGWYRKQGGTTYRGYFPTEELGNRRKGTCSVICTPSGSTLYDVYSRGTAQGGANGEIVAERALHVRLSSTSSSSVNSGYALAAVSKINLAKASTPVFKLGESTGFPRIASYDSSKGVPNLWTDITSAAATGRLEGTNVGDDALVAVKTDEMNLQNAIIYGKVAIAAGASITNNTWSGLRKDLYGQTGNSADDDATVSIKTAILVNLDIATKGATGAYRGYNLDALSAEMDSYDQSRSYSDADLAKVADSCILTKYTFEDGVFDPPVLSKLEGYGDGKARTTTADATPTVIEQNTHVLTLDASTATYYTNSDGQALNDVTTINVSGTVLLYAPRDFKAENGLTINYADSSSKLVIYSDGAVRIKMAASPTYTKVDGSKTEIAPKQFEINVSNGSEIDLKCSTGAFAGVVKAPKSAIKVSSSGNGAGRNSASAAVQMAGRLQLRGQFIADVIDLSGSDNVDILYDIQTKGSSASSSEIKVDSWKQILPAKFAEQLL